MKKYLHLLILGATIAATAFAVGSQPTTGAACSDSGCAACCTK
ncbi:MAG TPA: hypothetical protein VHD62_19120 [Opitutaceae bacterium]|nr:hypothetical protein [Opitutaceae bacterium]